MSNLLKAIRDGLWSCMTVEGRRHRIRELEGELAAYDERLALREFLGWVVFFVAGLAFVAGIGFSLHCIGQVYPALRMNLFYTGLISLGVGGFLDYCVVSAVITGPLEMEHHHKRATLAELKYQELVEQEKPAPDQEAGPA